jgi:hypothetical protein
LQCLDGPYATFVGSIKLEHAWEHIHERYTPPPATCTQDNKGMLQGCFPCWAASDTLDEDRDGTLADMAANSKDVRRKEAEV